jgi:hypothetical protein
MTSVFEGVSTVRLRDGAKCHPWAERTDFHSKGKGRFDRGRSEEKPGGAGSRVRYFPVGSVAADLPHKCDVQRPVDSCHCRD